MKYKSVTLASVSKNLRSRLFKPYRFMENSKPLRYGYHQSLGNEIIYLFDSGGEKNTCYIHFIHTGRTAKVSLSSVIIPRPVLDELGLSRLYK